MKTRVFPVYKQRNNNTNSQTEMFGVVDVTYLQ